MPTQEQAPPPVLPSAEVSPMQVPAHLQEFVGDIAIPDNLGEASGDGQQEKFAKVLEQASQLVDVAQQQLTESGRSTGDEYDDKKAVFDDASNMAVEAALAAEDEQGSVEALEALVALDHLGGYHSTNRPFRSAVSEGLGDNLLKALQGTRDLTINEVRVADGVRSDTRKLLSMATGKQLDSEFNATGTYDMQADQSFEYPTYDETLDMLAVVSAKQTKEDQLQGIDLISNWRPSSLLKQHLESGMNPAEMKALYKVAEAVGDAQNVYVVLKYDDPTAVLETAQKYGIENDEVVSLFGSEGKKGFYIIDQRKIDAYDKFHEMFEKAGVKQADLEESLKEFDNNSLRDLIAGVVDRGASPEEYVQDAVTNIQLKSAYKQAFSEIRYPVGDKKELFVKIDANQVPIIGERLAKLGLSPELSEEMFAAWDTYQAYADTVLASGTNDDLPQEAPTKTFMQNMVVSQQAEAIKYNLESVESFAEKYGVDTLHQIIDNFGIYNFARYKAPELIEQNERWLSGDDAAKSVVVNSRSDWNSFVGKGAVFEEVDSEGRFIFEAGSGAEVARVAVSVGQRERKAGRQPNVSDFIVHAHGNPNKMQMGANGEMIDTEIYHEAALKGQKLHNTELNDYKKHLGENFRLILQSCSTAGESDEAGIDNIAETMSEAHDTKVFASDVRINGLTIKADGSVEFKTDEGDSQPIIYEQ